MTTSPSAPRPLAGSAAPSARPAAPTTTPAAPAPPAPPVDRRRLLGRAAALGLAGWAGLSSAARAGSPPSVSADVDPSSLLRKLIGRITFGFTPAEWSRAAALGYEGYLEEQLNLTDADEHAAVLAALNAPVGTGLFPWLNATNSQVKAQYDISTSSTAASLYDSTIFRSVFSRQQLRERMVEFWSDHFSIDINTDQGRWLKLLDDRSVIRPNAMRSFEELLNASARSASMLNYLDNDVSRVNAINENYGRELLELHTVSVSGGYTQQDVIEVARCLTGWTWWRSSPPTPDELGTFRYNSANHDNNAKTLSPLFNLANPAQNFVIPAGGGQNDAQTILNILAAHPKTAGYIAFKLCRRFIGEDCPQSVINAVAAAYLSTTPKGDVKTMLRVMLDPNVLADATPRLKRPFHLIASALRGILPGTASITAFSTLRNSYNACGHLPFNWSPPDGYPDTNDYWTGLVLPRWNFCASVVSNSSGSNGGINGITFDSAALTAFFPTETTRDQHIATLNLKLFNNAWPVAEQNAVRNFLPTGTLSAVNKRDAISLALAAPSFQYV
jgi:hypothetical protein